MKVCLYGGSFDPIHSGHLKIIESLAKDYDEVWVVVASSSPFKGKHNASFEHRFKMCNIAININNVKVLDIEKREGLKYTYDVVRFLSNLYDYEFSFAIGADNLENIDKWYKIEELKNLVNFVVVSRGNFTGANYQITNPYSSSISRVIKVTGIADIDQYILTNNLYVNKYDKDFELVSKYVSRKRLFHIVNVYNLAHKLAITHNVDVDSCCLSAIYHDIYKEYATIEVINEFKMNNPEFKNYPSRVMHGVIAASELHKFNIKNDDVEFAIKYHPIGNSINNNVLKVLYIADYCEVGRKYHNEVKELLNIALTDLDKGYRKILISRTNYIIDNVGMCDDVFNLIKDIGGFNERSKR